MTPEQIEATRPAFETFVRRESNAHASIELDFSDATVVAAWAVWQAAKADTLAQAVAPEPVRLTDDEIDLVRCSTAIPQSTDCDYLNLSKAQIRLFTRAIEAALHAKGHALAPDGWIACADRLPNRWDEVLVWPYPSEYIMTATLGMEGQWQISEYISNIGQESSKIATPTHWMPLPAAPLTA